MDGPILLPEDAEFFAGGGEGVEGALELGGCVSRGELNADAGLALRNDRVAEADDVDAAFEEPVRQSAGERGIAEHDGEDRMLPRLETKAGGLQAGAEGAGIGVQAFAQVAAL